MAFNATFWGIHVRVTVLWGPEIVILTPHAIFQKQQKIISNVILIFFYKSDLFNIGNKIFKKDFDTISFMLCSFYIHWWI